jgi:myosin heavy subunit
MDLDVINEPEVLENVRRRFEKRKIHSFVESTLLVVNPYHFF